MAIIFESSDTLCLEQWGPTDEEGWYEVAIPESNSGVPSYEDKVGWLNKPGYCDVWYRCVSYGDGYYRADGVEL